MRAGGKTGENLFLGKNFQLYSIAKNVNNISLAIGASWS